MSTNYCANKALQSDNKVLSCGKKAVLVATNVVLAAAKAEAIAPAFRKIYCFFGCPPSLPSSCEVEIPRQKARLCASMVGSYSDEGHRGEHAITLTANASAALQGRAAIYTVDLYRLALIGLRHRLIDLDTRERLEKLLGKVFK